MSLWCIYIELPIIAEPRLKTTGLVNLVNISTKVLTLIHKFMSFIISEPNLVCTLVNVQNERAHFDRYE